MNNDQEIAKTMIQEGVKEITILPGDAPAQHNNKPVTILGTIFQKKKPDILLKNIRKHNNTMLHIFIILANSFKPSFNINFR